MDLEINFYEKTQVSVLVQTDAPTLNPEHELVLFGWYALRQFSNLKHNPASDVFAGILLWDDAVTELLKQNPQLPEIFDFVQHAHYAKFKNGEGMFSPESARELANIQMKIQLGADPVYSLIERDFLSALPQIVKPSQRPGDKRFIASFPPGNLDMKGFGILGRDVNYYACHSIVALLRSLAMRHTTEDVYLKRLSDVADSCGRAHMQNTITMVNQKELAQQFVAQSK